MTQLQAPSCYGQHWQATAVECRGGLDHGFWDKDRQTHVRQQCAYYSSCAQETNKRKTQPKPASGLIPVSNLTRNQPPQPPPSHPMVGVRPAYPVPQQYVQGQQYYPQTQQQQQQYYQPSPVAAAIAQMVPPWMAQMGAPMAPFPFQQPGAQMSAYLAVPEFRASDGSYLGTMGKEILRSAGKSSAHTIASFLDHNPLSRHPIPEIPEGQG